jgi:dTDP-4-dehydrorhamnose reductase
MQKVLVTGANGFVGYYLVKQLMKMNFEVIATGKGPCRLPFNEPNFHYAALDFTDAVAVQELFALWKPEVVVHNGALSKPDDCETNREEAFRVNVTGTLNLLHYAGLLQSFFVFVSTDFVFDGERGMYREEDERSPVNYYGHTKLLAEDEVMKYTVPWALVRTVLVYGPPATGRQNILTNTASALKKGETLKIFSDQERTPTYVEDLALGIARVVQQKAHGIFHLSGADRTTPYDMSVAVARHLKLDASLITQVTEKDFQQPARRPPKTGLVIEKAVKELQFKPRSFEEGLVQTFAAGVPV